MMFILRRMAYCWRVFIKLMTYFWFGLGSLFLATGLFPTLLLLSGFSRARFGRLARFSVHLSHKLALAHFVYFGLGKIHVEHRERLKGLRSKVVVANHPSILDVVILFSLIPNADCIVKGSLGQNRFMKGIVNSIYIVNSKTFEDQLAETDKSLKRGNCLIIFPEGTRSAPGQRWQFKKGAARFALHSKCDVVPIYIGGNDKIGLGKHDSLLEVNPTGRYRFALDVLEPIPIEKFLGYPPSQAAILLTQEMQNVLESRRNQEIAGA
jgi:1-acyl-sn-glycerol-3-phosphate acyltransferase